MQLEHSDRKPTVGSPTLRARLCFPCPVEQEGEARDVGTWTPSEQKRAVVVPAFKAGGRRARCKKLLCHCLVGAAARPGGGGRCCCCGASSGWAGLRPALRRCFLPRGREDTTSRRIRGAGSEETAG